MENATKALLIAAAVLIAILIISLTLVIYRQGANAVSSADLSEAEAAEFNGKFTVYEGENISTTKVNSLLETVFSHNKKEAASGSERFVKVMIRHKMGYPIKTLSDAKSDIIGTDYTVPKVTGNTYYTVKCNYNGTIINSIDVKANT